MTQFCKCGCGQEIVWSGRGRRKQFVNDAHRKRWLRQQSGIAPTEKKIDLDLAVRMYQIEQKSITEIAKHFGCSKQAVQYRLKNAGIELGKYKRRQRTSNHIAGVRKRIIELAVDSDMSTYDIASAVGTTESTVRRILKAEGIPSRLEDRRLKRRPYS